MTDRRGRPVVSSFPSRVFSIPCDVSSGLRLASPLRVLGGPPLLRLHRSWPPPSQRLRCRWLRMVCLTIQRREDSPQLVVHEFSRIHTNLIPIREIRVNSWIMADFAHRSLAAVGAERTLATGRRRITINIEKRSDLCSRFYCNFAARASVRWDARGGGRADPRRAGRELSAHGVDLPRPDRIGCARRASRR